MSSTAALLRGLGAGVEFSGALVDRQVIVLEVGAAYTKAGLAGEDAPRLMVRAIGGEL